jgi:predicted nucleotidyltransferase
LTAPGPQQKLAEIIEQSKEYHPQRVVLFRSFARGDYHAMSGADLVVVKETKRSFLACIGDVLTLCDYDVPLEPLVCTPQEPEQMRKEGNSFLEAVLREEVVAYEQPSVTGLRWLERNYVPTRYPRGSLVASPKGVFTEGNAREDLEKLERMMELASRFVTQIGS